MALLTSCAVEMVQRKQSFLLARRNYIDQQRVQLDREIALYNEKLANCQQMAQEFYWNLGPKQATLLKDFIDQSIKANGEAFIASLNKEQLDKVAVTGNRAIEIMKEYESLNNKIQLLNEDIKRLQIEEQAYQRELQAAAMQDAAMSNLFGNMLLYNALTQPQTVYVYPMLQPGVLK